MEGTNSEGGRRPCNISDPLTRLQSPLRQGEVDAGMPGGASQMERWGEGGGRRGTIDGRENGRGIDRMLSGGI